MTEHDVDNINPSVEYKLFIDWCHTCFEWEKTRGTSEEWAEIRKEWYPGKAPIDAVRKILRDRYEK